MAGWRCQEWFPDQPSSTLAGVQSITAVHVDRSALEPELVLCVRGLDLVVDFDIWTRCAHFLAGHVLSLGRL